jgi:hypothetical protein
MGSQRGTNHVVRGALRSRVAWLFPLALALTGAARADLLTLHDGERVQGKLVARGTKRIRLQTPYGLLVIPIELVDKIVHDDGTEEVLNAPAPTPAPPAPPAPPARLRLIITGKTFWQAWDPKSGLPLDPSLRFEVRLNDEAVAAFVDAKVDPGEIAGAVVNSFGFTPDATTVALSEGAHLLPSDTKPGRILLEVDLPGRLAGDRKLRFAYQANDGSPTEPVWRDLASTSLDVTLRADAPLFVRVDQDPGRMEFSKKQMRYVDTFHLSAHVQ